MISTDGVFLDALAETFRRKIDEARRLEEQFKHEEHDVRWRDYYAGRADGLAEALTAIEWPNVSASSPSVNADLPAVRSTAWLDALRKSVGSALSLRQTAEETGDCKLWAACNAHYADLVNLCRQGEIASNEKVSHRSESAAGRHEE